MLTHDNYGDKVKIETEKYDVLKTKMAHWSYWLVSRGCYSYVYKSLRFVLAGVEQL